MLRHLITSGAILFATTAGAQEAWPNRPVRLIVASAAGGGFDLMARILVEGLSQQLSQRVFIENNGTAGGLVAERMVAKGDPDGYTFLFQSASHATLPYIYKNPGYDVRADFSSVSLVLRMPTVMIVRPDLPARNIAELIALVKASPSKYSFGSSGIGGSSHIPLEAFKAAAGLDMVHVPYRGSGQTTMALIAGQIDVVVDGLAPQLGHIREGRVRALALTTKTRSPFMPELPIVAETLPGFEFNMWVAVYAPAKTPKAIIDKMSAAIAAAANSPAVKKRYEELLVEPVGSTPQELDAYLEEQLVFNKRIIERANIQVQE